MDRLLQEKNLLAKDYKEVKAQLKQHNQLVKRQENTIKDMIEMKEHMSREIERLMSEKDELEHEVGRTAQLL